MKDLLPRDKAVGNKALKAGVPAALLSLFVLLSVWEITALSGIFPEVLFPRVETVMSKFLALAASGIMVKHTLATLGRLLAGCLIGMLVGIGIGLLMAFSKIGERLLLPLVSLVMPIPSVAWVPLFILWFGLGSTPTVLLVAFSSCLPVIFNVWTGVKAVDVTWVRAGESLGAAGWDLFRRVVLPGSLPYLITGLRLGVSRGWRAVVAGEMLAATSWGLGFSIAQAREFLQTDIIFACLLVIGVLGLLMENFLFTRIEKATVVRWGMLKEQLK